MSRCVWEKSGLKSHNRVSAFNNNRKQWEGSLRVLLKFVHTSSLYASCRLVRYLTPTHHYRPCAPQNGISNIHLGNYGFSHHSRLSRPLMSELMSPPLDFPPSFERKERTLGLTSTETTAGLLGEEERRERNQLPMNSSTQAQLGAGIAQWLEHRTRD